jgi:hypothetical protein
MFESILYRRHGTHATHITKLSVQVKIKKEKRNEKITPGSL